MKKIPTAEEFIEEHYEVNVKNHFVGFDKRENLEETYDDYQKRNPLKTLEEGFIEFTKLHVEAQLEAILENVESYVVGGLTSEVDEDSIKKAYPLTNIK